MWWQFKSAFVRKIAYMLAALLFALVLHTRAHAATFVVVSCTTTSPFVPAPQTIVGSWNTWGQCALQLVSNAGSATSNGSGGFCSPPSGVTANGTLTGTPTSATNSTGWTFKLTGNSACTAQSSFSVAETSSAGTPGSCTGASGGTYDMALQDTSVAQPMGSTGCGSDNCLYTFGPTTSFRTWATTVGGKVLATQTAVKSNTSCTYGNAVAPTPQSAVDTGVNTVQDCQSTGSVIHCVTQATNGTYCGTYNGDQVCVGAVPAGKCVAYTSGGVACTVLSSGTMQSPPAPDNGTANTPATPTSTLSDTVAGTTITTNYYNSAVAAASHNPAVAASAGTTGTGTGTSTGTGTVAGGTGSGTTVGIVGSAANGDCSASGVNCGGDGVTPTLSTEPDAQTSLNTYWSALGSVPIVAALSGITTAFSGSASCETFTFTMFSHDYVMDEHCTLINGIASTIGAIMLAVYTLTAFRIVLST